MKNSKCKIQNVFFERCLFAFLIFNFAFAVSAQTGGTFDLSHNVIASGGGSNSSGGQFSLSGTAGQTSAGSISSGGNFSLRAGFWAFNSLAPTAALVSVSGKVTTANGQGIRNVRLTLTNGSGVIRTMNTTSFGNFRFEEIEVGQTYILEVSSRKFVFANPTRVLTIQEGIADADFTAEDQ